MFDINKTDDEIESLLHGLFLDAINASENPPSYIDFFEPCEDHERAYKLLFKFYDALVLIVRKAHGLAFITKAYKTYPSKKEAIKRLDKILINIEKTISALREPSQYFGHAIIYVLSSLHDLDPKGKPVDSGLNMALKNLSEIRDCIKAARQSYGNGGDWKNTNMALPNVAQAITQLFEGGDCGDFSLYENGLACQSVVAVMACINHHISPQTARAALTNYSKNKNFLADTDIKV